VSYKGIQPNPDNIANILAMPPPTTVTEVRRISIMVHVHNSIIDIKNIMIKKHKNRINIIIVRLNEPQ
jgi:hypothetical protein